MHNKLTSQYELKIVWFQWNETFAQDYGKGAEMDYRNVNHGYLKKNPVQEINATKINL